MPDSPLDRNLSRTCLGRHDGLASSLAPGEEIPPERPDPVRELRHELPVELAPLLRYLVLQASKVGHLGLGHGVRVVDRILEVVCCRILNVIVFVSKIYT